MPKTSPPFCLESLNSIQWQQHGSIKKINFWETPKTAGSPSFSRLSVRSFVLPWGTTVCVSHPWLVFCVNMYSEFMLLFVWLTVHLSARGDLREGLQTRAIVKKVLLWANASWGLRLWWFRLCLKQVCGCCSHDLDTLTYLSIMMESRKNVQAEMNWPPVSKRVCNEGCVHEEAAALGIFGHTWAPVEGCSDIPQSLSLSNKT